MNIHEKEDDYMYSNAIRRILSAALAAMLLCPAAMAENPSDNVTGYNPFTGVTTTVEPGVSPNNPFSNSTPGNPFGGTDLTAPQGADGTLTADDLFGQNTTATADDLFAAENAMAGLASTGTASTGTGTAGAVNDPFGTGTASTGTAGAVNDPFGTGTASTGTAGAVNDPFGTGTASTGTGTAGAVSDPFGMGTGTAAASATPIPAPTVSGYNPFVAGSSNDAQAAEVIPMNTVMFVTASSLKLRAKAAENGKVVGTAYFGQQLAVTASQGDWAQITTPKGGTGYCQMNGLSAADPNTMSRMMYAQLATTPVYKAPSQKMGRLRNLKKGDTVTMTAITTDGLWARVTADNQSYGFIPSIYLDDTPAAEGTPVWCVSGSTAVMVNPDAWIQISTLSFGQPCFLVGYVNNNAIAKIRSSKGYVAYCDASALTTVNPANLNTPVYIQATGKVMANSTGDKAKYYNVNKNNRVTLLGVDSSSYWALVKWGKRKLYIPFIFLGTDRPGNNYRVVVTNQDVPLYSANTAGASVLGTLPLGTRLYLMGGDNLYAKVSTVTDGVNPATNGFVPLQYLRGE